MFDFDEAHALNGIFSTATKPFVRQQINPKYLEQIILAGSDIWIKHKAIGAIGVHADGIKSYEMLETLVEFKHEHLIMISTNRTKCVSAI